jgi:hypothetical protein
VPSWATDLERLEPVLARMSAADANRFDVSARLRRLLTALDAQAAIDVDTGSADRIQSASADEIFDYIDKELGRAST